VNRVFITFLMVLSMSAPILNGASKVATWDSNVPDIEKTYGLEELIQEDIFNSIRNFDSLAIGEISAKDMPLVLARMKEMPKLQTIKFFGCDLSNLDEKSPALENVKTVLIANGKFSQGTFRWLAKFPKGSELVFGGLDMRGSSFDDLGKFTWITFDNCKISNSALKLIGKVTEVAFKEVTLVESK